MLGFAREQLPLNDLAGPICARKNCSATVRGTPALMAFSPTLVTIWFSRVRSSMGAFVFHFVRAQHRVQRRAARSQVSATARSAVRGAAPEERAAHAGWESAMSAEQCATKRASPSHRSGVMLVRMTRSAVPAR